MTSGASGRIASNSAGLPAVFGHHLVETGIARVGHAAALVKTRDDIVFDGAEQRQVLREHREVCFPLVAQQAAVLGRQTVSHRIGIVLEHAGDGQAAEPFAHVALIETGIARQRFAGDGLARGQPRQKAGAMTERDQLQHAAFVEGADETLLEGRRAVGVESLDGIGL